MSKRCPANKWYYQGKCQKLKTHKHHVGVVVKGDDFPVMSYEVHPIKYKHYDVYSLHRHLRATGYEHKWQKTKGRQGKYYTREASGDFERFVERDFREKQQKETYPLTSSYEHGSKVDWSPVTRRMERERW